jgi:REP-associated tyrosine transposase
MFIHHRQTRRSFDRVPPCRNASTATTAADTSISSLLAATIAARCWGLRAGEYWFVKILEQVRVGYGFIVVGYVVMPEHIHLLISEPERGNPSTVMQVLKQRFARRVLGEWRRRGKPGQSSLWREAFEQGHIWQKRFYDFVVRSEAKKMEKLRYMHHNPVKRRLVLEPEQWKWSSSRWYAYGEAGIVLVNEQRPAVMKRGRRQSFVESGTQVPTF